MNKISRMILAFLLCLPLLGAQAAEPNSSELSSEAPTYLLGKGDRLRVTVFGEEDLSGEFTVDSSGRIALPLAGAVAMVGLDLRQAEQAITARLRDGYLRNPKVSVDVTNFRPFYILGEVSRPGAYPYAPGLRVTTAAALAGGFSYRADKGDIIITRPDKDGRTHDFAAGLDAFVLPGDSIKVGERFF